MSQNTSRNKGLIIAIGILCFITLIAFVYAFVQQAEAKRQSAMVIECEKNSIQVQQQIEDRNRQLAATIESLRIAVIDATQRREQALKKLK